MTDDKVEEIIQLFRDKHVMQGISRKPVERDCHKLREMLIDLRKPPKPS